MISQILRASYYNSSCYGCISFDDDIQCDFHLMLSLIVVADVVVAGTDYYYLYYY